MELLTPKCPECGASLPAATPGTSLRCAYCGSTVVLAPEEAPAAPPASAPEADPPAPAKGGKVKCRECGHLNEPYYRFCLGCGAEL